MTRKGHNHSLQTNQRHHKEETMKLNIHHTIQVKQLAVSQQEFRTYIKNIVVLDCIDS